MAGDFHVHGYPADGALPAAGLAHEARRRGLDVIAITDHNRVVFHPAGDPASGASAVDGVLVIPGEEITMAHADMAAVGIDRAFDWHGAIVDVARRVHDAGGVAIAAHPIGDDARAYDARVLAAVDGVEAAHPAMFLKEGFAADIRESYRRARENHAGIAAIGSSDFHFSEPVGLCRTYLLVSSVDRAGVLDAIRAGRTVACDATGGVIGPPALAARVAPLCAADMGAMLAVNRGAATVCALLALLALAVLVGVG
ncbi:MAG TPA: CehA/McbA family metallohydrolase [Dongiaceae bacterium]|nr:CehA/McbA family metallohydrolase [Dongiaceae bacterium]